MKNLFRYILILIVGSSLFFSCEVEPDLRKPETPHTFPVYIEKGESSDLLVDLNNLNNMNIILDVNAMYPDDISLIEKVQVVVVRNGDYGNQYVIADNITSLPAQVTIDLNTLIGTIPSLNSASDIKEADMYTFFATVVMADGTVYPGYTEFGAMAFSPSLVNSLNAVAPGATFDASFPTPCPYNINDFVGDYNFYDLSYPSENTSATVELDPDSENGLIINGIWGLTANAYDPVPFTVYLDTRDLSTITWPEQGIGSDMWGYGPGTARAGAGTFSTCDLTLELAPFVCVSLGCFGNLPIMLEKVQ